MGHKRKRNYQKVFSSSSSSSSNMHVSASSTTTTTTSMPPFSSSSIASTIIISSSSAATPAASSSSSTPSSSSNVHVSASSTTTTTTSMPSFASSSIASTIIISSSSAASSSTATSSSSSSICMDVKSKIQKIDNENMTFYDLLEATTMEDSMDAVLPFSLTPIKVDSDDEEDDVEKLIYKKCVKIPMLRTPSSSSRPYDNNNNDSSNTKETEYEVEKILLKRNNENFYFLKWLNYPLNESTWEISWNLSNCDAVMKAFEDRQKLCFKIYKSLPNKDEYKGYLDTWINGILTTAFIEACILEEIFMKFCATNGFKNFYVENWTRFSEVYPDFTFLAENIFSQKAKLVLEDSDTPANLCKCNECGKNNQPCQCINDSITATGILSTSEEDFATECHRKCKCGKKCLGKIYQRGRTIPVILFKTPHCGWGLRTAIDIKVNKFVVEYVGHVKLYEECRGIPDESYLFDIDIVDDDDENDCSKKSAYFVIDATKEGNSSRFINHSCDPNLQVKLIKGYYAQKKYARVIFIANRHIQAGEELTFNYYKHQPNMNLVNSATPICHCGFERCRKYLI